MKASQLRPGQWFEYLGTDKSYYGQRCLFIGCDSNGKGKTFYNYAVQIDGMFEWDFDSEDFEVNADVPQCWPGDEPLQLREGVDLIASERKRQIEKEGWSSRHDDTINRKGELAKAAICYAAISCSWAEPDKLEDIWPYDSEWWKPSHTSSIRNLVKAGALIAAEIDRLQRTKQVAEVPPPQPEPTGTSLDCQPRAFQPGDWVVCVDVEQGGLSGVYLKVGDVYKVHAINYRGDVVIDGLAYYPYRFRHARPDEIPNFMSAAEVEEAYSKINPAVLTPMPANDGWIEWHGGYMPVDGDTLVDVRFWDGATGGPCEAKYYWWGRKQYHHPSHISAYRVIKESKSPKALPATEPSKSDVTDATWTEYVGVFHTTRKEC